MHPPGRTRGRLVAVPHPRWEERPLAIVIPGADPPTEAQLREHLARHLPRWQLPDEIRFTGELPRTGVGKIDKPALRAAYTT